MWSRLDDDLLTHPKLYEAAHILGGEYGGVAALGFYSMALMYANKHLTDGFLPKSVVSTLPHAKNPLRIADALTRVGLFDKAEGGYRIHDFHDHNPSAVDIKRKRREDKRRKALDRANGHAR